MIVDQKMIDKAFAFLDSIKGADLIDSVYSLRSHFDNKISNILSNYIVLFYTTGVNHIIIEEEIGGLNEKR